MIRLVYRKLTIPRGDSGSFTIPLLENISPANAIAVLSIFDANNRIFQKEYSINNKIIECSFESEETNTFPIGSYNWDIKIYTNPQYNSKGLLINGDEVHSYYAAFELPRCEIVPFSLKEKRVIK